MQELWEYCRQMNVVIFPHYVPSKLNPADMWSRQQITLTEVSLDPRSMEIIWKKFWWMRSGTDSMASAVNRQCPKFISEYPQPGAFGVDIFMQRTHKVSPGFCNPPWHLIPKMLTFLEEGTHYEVLLVVPYHQLKPWGHKFQSMTQMTITIYQATYQLPAGVADKARQPMIFSDMAVSRPKHHHKLLTMRGSLKDSRGNGTRTKRSCHCKSPWVQSTAK